MIRYPKHQSLSSRSFILQPEQVEFLDQYPRSCRSKVVRAALDHYQELIAQNIRRTRCGARNDPDRAGEREGII